MSIEKFIKLLNKGRNYFAPSIGAPYLFIIMVKGAKVKIDEFVKSLKMRFFVIPAKFPIPRLGGHPRTDENVLSFYHVKLYHIVSMV